jgi:hypothetical protein
VVATQTTLEGRSLSNGVERYIAAAWQRYLPNETDPPIFIQRQLFNQTATRFQAVTFAQRVGRYEVGSPSWCPVTGRRPPPAGGVGRLPGRYPPSLAHPDGTAVAGS